MRENGRAGGTAEAQGPGGLEKSVDCAGAAGRRRAGRWGGEGRQLGFGKSQTKSLGWGRGETRGARSSITRRGKLCLVTFSSSLVVRRRQLRRPPAWVGGVKGGSVLGCALWSMFVCKKMVDERVTEQEKTGQRQR